MKCNVKVHCRVVPCSGYHRRVLVFLQDNTLNRTVFALAEIVISFTPAFPLKTKHWTLSFLIVLCYDALSFRILN